MITRRCLLMIAAVSIVGCGGEEPFRKTTSPVKGKITVDGAAPGSAVQMHCHPVSGMDTEHPTFSQSDTDADGNFSIATYAAGDGVPAGDYLLTFSWQEFSLFAREYSGPDKLNGRYSDPETSQIKLTVTGGDPVDMGVIELTTK